MTRDSRSGNVPVSKVTNAAKLSLMITALIIIYCFFTLLTVLPMAVLAQREVSTSKDWHDWDADDWVPALLIGFIASCFWPIIWIVAGGIRFFSWVARQHSPKINGLLDKMLGDWYSRTIRQENEMKAAMDRVIEMRTAQEKETIRLKRLESLILEREAALDEHDRRMLARQQAASSGWQQPHTEDHAEDLSTVLTRPRHHTSV